MCSLLVDPSIHVTTIKGSYNQALNPTIHNPLQCHCSISQTSRWLKLKLQWPWKGEKIARGKVSPQRSWPICFTSASDLAVSSFTKELFSFCNEALRDSKPFLSSCNFLNRATAEWKWDNRALQNSNETYEVQSESGKKCFTLNRRRNGRKTGLRLWWFIRYSTWNWKALISQYCRYWCLHAH